MFLLNLEMLLIGPKKTRELCLLGELVDGKEAERIGLVNKAVPEDKLEEEVMKYARLICLQPIDGLVMGKAFNQLALEIYGMSAALTQGYIGHSYFTNISFESDEYNFFKERRDRGAKAGFHERDARYSKIK
jgi:enoyl-CoA hydratase